MTFTVGTAAASADSKLQDFAGKWIATKRHAGCFSPILIEQANSGVKILRGDGSTSVPEIAPYPAQAELQENQFPTYKISTHTVAKFVRGKIVSAHIWNADNGEFMGVGMRVWQLTPEGTLAKKKAGVTVGTKKNNSASEQIFDLDENENMIKWTLECEYKRAQLAPRRRIR